MQTQIPANPATATQWSVTHPISPADKAAVATMRAIVEPQKGRLQGIAARGPFDEIMGHVAAPADVTYEPDTIGGVSGWWARPTNKTPVGTILYLHGGWYIFGTAKAYRHLAGHVADRSGAEVFVPDYRLAPEHPFPAGLLDAQACYRGLIDRDVGQPERSGGNPTKRQPRDVGRIAIAGDSAGGGLTLALLSLLKTQETSGGVRPSAALVLSPLTDLTLSGRSWETRAAADPYFTKAQGASMVPLYLGSHDAKDPLASPLYGDLAGLPPIRVHVGDDELLLDDSLRYVERAVAAGVDARVDIWEGLPHVFPSAVGQLEAADRALSAIASFLTERLGGT
jgi:monoterpene epsilon-lactone hydrolase